MLNTRCLCGCLCECVHVGVNALGPAWARLPGHLDPSPRWGGGPRPWGSGSRAAGRPRPIPLCLSCPPVAGRGHRGHFLLPPFDLVIKQNKFTFWRYLQCLFFFVTQVNSIHTVYTNIYKIFLLQAYRWVHRPRHRVPQTLFPRRSLGLGECPALRGPSLWLGQHLQVSSRARYGLCMCTCAAQCGSACFTRR